MSELFDDSKTIVNYRAFKDRFKQIEENHSVKLTYIDQIDKQAKLVILVSKSGYYSENRYFLSIGMDFQTDIVEAYAHKNEVIDKGLTNDLKIETEKYLRQLQLVSTFSA